MAFSTKHYFWLGNIILLGLVVWFGVSLGMSILGQELADMVKSDNPVTEGQQSVQQMRSLSQYEVIARENMFGGKEEDEEKAVAAAKNDADKSKKPPPPPSAGRVDMRLKGTIVDRELPELSVAILENPKNMEQDIYRPGDKIGAVEVVRVDRESVIMRQGGQEIELKFDDNKPTPPAARKPNSKNPPPSAKKAAPPPSDKVVESVGPNSYVISRDTLSEQMNNLGQFMSQVRIAPYFKNGEAHGFRVAHVQPESTVFQLGLRKGDVITNVNDVPVNNPQDLMNIYHQIQQLETVMIDIERRGQPVTIQYSLR